MKSIAPFKKLALVAMTLLLLLIASPVYAAAPHLNPDLTDKPVSDADLFLYYTNALNLTAAGKYGEAVWFFKQLPFASLPQGTERISGAFAASGIELCSRLSIIDANLEEIKQSILNLKYGKAIPLSINTIQTFYMAYSELLQIERAAVVSGEKMGAVSASPNSTLHKTYRRLLTSIISVRVTIEHYRQTMLVWIEEFSSTGNSALLTELSGMLADLDRLAELVTYDGDTDEITSRIAQVEYQLNKLQPEAGGTDFSTLIEQTSLLESSISCSISPSAAFVGDKITISGLLMTEGHGLGSKKVRLLVNGAPYVSVQTGADGSYETPFAIPWQYTPEITLQVLYQPQGEDMGLYRPAQSAPVKLIVNYYTAELSVKLKGAACPGKKFRLYGKLNYTTCPAPEERTVNVYLDNNLIDEFSAGADFSREIKLAAQTPVGSHQLAVFAPAEGRYAPVEAACELELVKIQPQLLMDTPAYALMPGTLNLQGQILSERTPLEGARILISLYNSETTAVSDASGNFHTSLKLGLGLGFLGTQRVNIKILPQEPWYSSLYISKNIMLVNILNIGVVFLALLIVAVHFSRMIHDKKGLFSLRERIPAVTALQQKQPIIPSAPALASINNAGDSSRRVIYYYRLVVRLIQQVFNVFLRLPQTLREFALENERRLGSAGRYFLEFTRLIEKLLYSRHQASDAETAHSRHLANEITASVKPNHEE